MTFFIDKTSLEPMIDYLPACNINLLLVVAHPANAGSIYGRMIAKIVKHGLLFKC